MKKEELEFEQEKYRTLVEQIPGITYIVDVEEKKTIYISPQVEIVLGFGQKEWMETPDLWSSQIHPDDQVIVVRVIGEHDVSRKSFEMEYRILDKNGNQHWVSNRGVYMSDDDDGTHWLLHGMMFDITQQKIIETELQKKISELEMFTKIAVGRELKMKKVEEEIEALKNKLKKQD